MKLLAKAPEQKTNLEGHKDALECMKADAEKLCESIQEVTNKLVKRANGAMSRFVGEGDEQRSQSDLKPKH